MNVQITNVNTTITRRRFLTRSVLGIGVFNAHALLLAAAYAAVEPAAIVTMTVEASKSSRCELAISEDALIEKLGAALPDPINRDDFNHADTVLKLGDRIVGGYELVVATTNLVKDGRFELPMEKSPWNGLRRREYSVKSEAGQPGKVFWIESDKIQNTRLSQRVQLEKDRLYLLSYAGYSDVQAYDFAVQLVDPARKYNAQLPHSHKRPLHYQRLWARYQHLVRADIESPELWIGAALKGRAGVTDIQLHPARWRLVADLPRAGSQKLILTYVPRMGRHMTPPPAEPKSESALPPAKVTVGKVELVAPNPDGVLVKTPRGAAWTLPSDWPLRIDRLRDSRPTVPVAHHEVTVARGVDATILLALDLKGDGFKLESLRCELPVKVSALRLASVPVNRFGNMDEVVYRQLDPMVEVNDPLVPFDPNAPTVLALTIQCAEQTTAGVHDGAIELKLEPASGKPFALRLPVRARVLPVTAQPIKHFGTCFGNQHLLASYAMGDTYTEHGIPVADFHGLDRKTRATPAGTDALRKLARDYIHRMLDFDIEPHAPTMLAGFTYKVADDPNGGPPKLMDWDFAEFDRSLEMFTRHGLRDICVDHTNGDILNTKRLANQVTYSYMPPPKPNTPRWRQLSEDEFWRLVGDYYEQFASHLAAKGWLDGAYILLDESSVASDPVIRRFAQTLRAQPHAARLRLLNTHYHTAIYTSRLNGGHDGRLTMEGVLDVFVPQNNDHFNFWPEDDIWPRDRGPLPAHWVYYTETDHLDLPHAGLSTELMALKCRWLGARGMLIWGSFIWSMPYKRTDVWDWGGGASGPVMNPWINPNYAHGQGLLSFFYPPDPRGPAKEPTLKITPSYRLALLRDGLQDNALWEIAKAGVDDAGKPVRISPTQRDKLQEQLNATFINPVQWRVSRPHHHAWQRTLVETLMISP